MSIEEFPTEVPRIHWTAHLSVCLCLLSGISCPLLLFATFPQDLNSIIPADTLLEIIALPLILAVPSAVLAFLVARKPEWSKGRPLAKGCLYVGCFLFGSVFILGWWIIPQP